MQQVASIILVQRTFINSVIPFLFQANIAVLFIVILNRYAGNVLWTREIRENLLEIQDLSWVVTHYKDLGMDRRETKNSLVSGEWNGQDIWRRNCIWHLRVEIKFQLTWGVLK